ncbi:MAG: hypothetical protein ACQ9MH_05500 [Nitrospinales bacterium]
MSKDITPSIIIYTLCAILAVGGAIVTVMQVELIALLCPIVVLFVPIIILCLWLNKKFRGISYSEKIQKYILKLRILVIAGWLVSFIPGVGFAAIYFHIYDPWPFSMEQGPDTPYATEGFRKSLGFKMSSEVAEVFFKGYEIRDFDYYLRFHSCSENISQKVLEGLQKDSEVKPTPSFHLNSKLSWWFEADESKKFEHWGGDQFKEVWIDRDACIFFVRRWTT